MRRARDTLSTAAWGALPVWLGSRALVALVAVGGMTLTQDRQVHDVPTFLSLWERWDVGWFRDLARFGYYDPRMPDPNGAAFFPGMPLALRVVHVLVSNWVLAGLVVSLVAGGVASVALWRLAAEERGSAAGTRAVIYWVACPYALFLFAGYSEALFCAFAFSSWLAARHERWPAAGLLAAGAAAVRVSGIPFAVALAVQYVVQRHRAGGWRRVLRPEAAWLAAPAVSVAAYFAYLHAHSGRWNEYSYVLQRGGRLGLRVSRATV
ncbi:MAG: hypothetical protein LC640_05300 [Frankia sp.]|nr:hypothetical protein [Frankia sp.]